jgi:hypothetical protein
VEECGALGNVGLVLTPRDNSKATINFTYNLQSTCIPFLAGVESLASGTEGDQTLPCRRSGMGRILYERVFSGTFCKATWFLGSFARIVFCVAPSLSERSSDVLPRLT